MIVLVWLLVVFELKKKMCCVYIYIYGILIRRANCMDGGQGSVALSLYNKYMHAFFSAIEI